jgi:putative acyl-CoA dehydrogenase
MESPDVGTAWRARDARGRTTTSAMVLGVSSAMEPHATHDVFNQVGPLADHDPLARDPALAEGIAREGAAWAHELVSAFGREVASAPVLAWAEAANRNVPVLHTHDATGRRVDVVEFHPAYHSLMTLSMKHGLHALPWREPRAGAHVARAALFRLASENEFGHGCPISMTYSAIPAVRREPALASVWEPLATSLEYDARFLPANEKAGVTLGMAMTEKQGGSDVRANTTRAEPFGSAGEYVLVGHKWFCSAPMSDAFLMLAQAPAGLSCFLVPRFRPDGTQNALRFQRLKDKLGNRSNASSELELEGAWAQRIGEEGRGVRTIMEMVNHTRLDCVIGSAALMRRAVVQAIHHARQRRAFGRPLIEQPLMQNVLADLALESEAASALMLRLARAYDASSLPGNGRAHEEALMRRLATACAKYWVCKRAPALAAEALECLGGNGYVETFPLARLYRDAPLNSIWEGPGNVLALDVLRAMDREPHTLSAVLSEIKSAASGEKRLARHLEALEAELAAGDAEYRARRHAERLALGLQAALLLEHAPSFVSDAFCATRLGGDWGHAFGTLPAGTRAAALIERAFPPS